MRTPMQVLRSWFPRRESPPAESDEVARARTSFASFYNAYASPDSPLYTYEQFARAAYGAAGETGNAVVFSCIGRRMSVFSEATFKWRRLSNKKLWGDEGLQKLEHPWPGGSTGAMFARAEQDVSLAGNAFIRDTGDGLERLRPDWVTIVSEVQVDQLGEQVRRVIGYAYDPVGDPDRSLAFYPATEVAHWAPIPDPLAYFRGMSWLTPVVREVNADVRMAEFRDAYFRNAATANLVITYKDKVAPERIERIKTAIAARHSGVENAFGTMVFDEGADLTVVGSNMEGAAFDALQAAGETRICMAAGVPAIVVGARQGLQASAIGEYQQALRAFADMTMRPNWRSFCAALETLAPPPPGSQLWFDVSDVSALRQGEKDQADTMVQMAAAANQFFMAGFSADSIVEALSSGDVTLLVHTGVTSVQAQPGSSPPPAGNGMPMNGKAPAMNGAGG